MEPGYLILGVICLAYLMRSVHVYTDHRYLDKCMWTYLHTYISLYTCYMHTQNHLTSIKSQILQIKSEQLHLGSFLWKIPFWILPWGKESPRLLMWISTFSCQNKWPAKRGTILYLQRAHKIISDKSRLCNSYPIRCTEKFSGSSCW